MPRMSLRCLSMNMVKACSVLKHAMESCLPFLLISAVSDTLVGSLQVSTNQDLSSPSRPALPGSFEGGFLFDKC